MAAQPPCDESCNLVVSETVVDLEHAQFDRREALRRQAAGHTSHVLDGPDAISVSGREPDPRAETIQGAWHDVAVQDREGSKETLAGRDVGCDVPADREPGSENARGIDTDAGNPQHLAHAVHHVAIILGHVLSVLPDPPPAPLTESGARTMNPPRSARA